MSGTPAPRARTTARPPVNVRRETTTTHAAAIALGPSLGGTLRLRLGACVLAVVGWVALLDLWGFPALLGLHAAERKAHTTTTIVLMGTLLVGLEALLWAFLAPCERYVRTLKRGTLPDDALRARAQAAALGAPWKATALGVTVALLGIAAGGVADYQFGTADLFLVALQATASVSAIAVCAIPIFVYFRRVLRPLVAHFAAEAVPEGQRIGIVSRLAACMVAVAAVAVLVPALLSAALIGREERALREERYERLLDLVPSVLPSSRPEALDRVARRVRMRDGAHLLPSADAAIWTSSAEWHEVKRASPLAITYRHVGGTPQVALLGAALSALLAAGLLGVAVGRRVRGDIVLVTRRLAAQAESDRSSPQIRSPAIEVARLMDAVAHLQRRLSEMSVAQYVAIERALEAERLKTRFLAHTSHDLRAPLSSILGFSELLQQGAEGPITDDQRSVLASVHRKGRELLHLMNETLDVAKLESGALEPRRQWTPPAAILADAAHQAKAALVDRKMEVASEVQPGLAPIYVDGHRIAQAVAFLLARLAGAATESRVAVQARRDGPSLVVRMDGAAQAVEAGEVQKMLDGFQRVPGQAGLNLGPYLARRFIEMHGGKVVVESGPGGGTTIVVTVPAEPTTA